MFDISGGKFLLVMIIGLVVLGPKRLPVVVRTFYCWIRMLRLMAKSVQTELARDFNLHEIQGSLKNIEHIDLVDLCPDLKEPYNKLKKKEKNIVVDNSYAEDDSNQFTDNAVRSR
ncbi:Sec-independent protein translocase protein TatB [Serratia marcescens]|uniref:Sec-independent protein translocase protein TatB n=1 Tax=Serratia TaxID=613 RepID=UPI003B9E08AA